MYPDVLRGDRKMAREKISPSPVRLYRDGKTGKYALLKGDTPLLLAADEIDVIRFLNRTLGIHHQAIVSLMVSAPVLGPDVLEIILNTPAETFQPFRSTVKPAVRCRVCGTRLRSERSKALGVGPGCYKRIMAR